MATGRPSRPALPARRAADALPTSARRAGRRRGCRARPTSGLDPRPDLGHGPVEVVVHDDVVRQRRAFDDLPPPDLKTSPDVLLGISPTPEAGLQDLERRGHNAKDERRRLPRPDLAGPLDVDLEHHVPPGRRGRRRGAVIVVEESSPLEETATISLGEERRLVDENVGVGRLTRPTGAGRPGPTEPERRVRLDQSGDESALADTPGPAEDDDQCLVVPLSRASR